MSHSRFAPRRLPHPGSCVVCSIAPPHLLIKVVQEGSTEARDSAVRSLSTSAAIRARRSTVGRVTRESNASLRSLGLLPVQAGEQKTVYDAENKSSSEDLPGTKARGEGEPPVEDEAVNEAYDGGDVTYDLYQKQYGRNSLDGAGMEMVSSVHFQRNLDNAFWNGTQMLYGDGSGEVFKKGAFTKAIDVIGHEMTHGVIQFSAGLIYSKQPGALNESFADVFGMLVKQYHLKQSSEESDWLIGAGTLGPAMPGEALRSMKAPGTAFEGDNQPGNMKDYMDLPDDGNPQNDSGGVHINSGIPNHAFYLAAMEIGGNAWEKAGKIWYETLTKHIGFRSAFKETAEATVFAAGNLFGSGGSEHKAVEGAWKQVGVL